MVFENTDKDWEKFGKNDPYFGVVTHETFSGNKLDDKQLESFFNSGKRVHKQCVLKHRAIF